MQKVNGKIIRLLDANFNRAKEGLRVCEDITRFILNKKAYTRRYKMIRHKLSDILKDLPLTKLQVIKERDIAGDVGKKTIHVEFNRKNVKDIFCANSQRVKESIRVLEEFAKLMSKKNAQELKEIRYQIYDIETRIVKEF